MKKILFSFLLGVVALVLHGQSTSVVDKNQATKKVAIYVANDTGNVELNDKTKSLEMSLSARINNIGFSVVNHELVIKNLNDYLNNPNSKNRAVAAKLKNNLKDESLGTKIFEESSGVRLAELLGADYIIVVSFDSFGSEKKSFSGYGVKTENTVYKLRTNYNLYDAGMGTGSVGGAIETDKVVRQIENLNVDDNDLLNELVAETAKQITASLDTQNKDNRVAAKADARGRITINFVIENMSMPELVKKGDNYIISTNSIPLTIPSVNADIDGVSQTLGGQLSLAKGIHTLKINQKDIVAVEKNINVTGEENQIITFVLQLTDDARMRWKADMAFIEEIKNRAKMSQERGIITEAEAVRIRAIGKMYEQSGFKVDAKSLPEIQKTQSIFSN